jgi:hypothetical protein
MIPAFRAGRARATAVRQKRLPLPAKRVTKGLGYLPFSNPIDATRALCCRNAVALARPVRAQTVEGKSRCD